MSAQIDILEQVEFNVKEKYKEIYETCHNVRRGIFARVESHKKELGDMFLQLHKEVTDLKKEIDFLKETIQER